MKDTLKPLQLSAEKIFPFVQLDEENVSKLLPILETRLPYSVFMYNSAVVYPRFRDRMTFYTLFGDVDESSWIVSVVVAEDFGLNYTISASQELSKISKSEAIKILESCPLFLWDETHMFTPLQQWLASIVFDVSVYKKGNVMEVHPNRIYWVDLQDAKKIEVDLIPRNESDLKVATTPEIRRLDPISGLKFILSTWKFAKEGASHVISRAIKRNESAAVYINGEPVCGLIFHCFGMISALYTLESHRGKGYAKLAMQYVFKELANSGIIPASGVDLRNEGSDLFHKKLGFQVSSETCQYMFSTKAHY